jgi:hypothetical protein
MEQKQEIWKDIPKYEGIYQCSILGGVRRIIDFNNYRMLKPNFRGGTMCVSLSKNGMSACHQIKDLLALTFLDYELKMSEFKAIHVNNQKWDLTRTIDTDATLKLFTWDDKEGKETYWHSSAHLMAEALAELYPDTKFGIGPAIEAGFYYDIDLGGKSLSSDDLAAIEKKMRQLAEKKSPFVRSEVAKSDAITYFTQKADQYKLELLQDLNDGEITFYQQGAFTDLCRGPHIPNTG